MIVEGTYTTISLRKEIYVKLCEYRLKKIQKREKPMSFSETISELLENQTI